LNLEAVRRQALHPFRELPMATRWELANERGTPALTMQAGRMSKPIAERLGFEFVGQARLYVDTL